MPAAPDTIHLSPRAEHTRNACGARTNERGFPEPRHVVRAPAGLAGQLALVVDAYLQRAVGWWSEPLGGAHLFVRRGFAQCDRHVRRVADNGAVPANGKRPYRGAVGRAQRHRGQRLAAAEVQRLARELTGDGPGGGKDNQRTLTRRRRLPGDVLRNQRREDEQQRHVEIRGPLTVLSAEAGRSKYASTSSRSSSSS